MVQPKQSPKEKKNTKDRMDRSIKSALGGISVATLEGEAES